jgi:DNA-binding transcriptional MerR regulator/methylmalonyl-CoA mutase cobalamin-binding subunit
VKENINTPQHPIQVVSRRTGLTSDVIRAWERRYQVIEPQRASNGRRLYTDLDVEKLTLLKRATHAGRRIGDITHLTTEELYALVETDDKAAAQALNIPTERPSTGSVMEHFEECLDAVTALEAGELKKSLNHAANTLGVPFLLEDLLRPLIAHIRDECRRGNMHLAQERMATSLVRSYMCMLAAPETTNDSDYKIIVTTPVQQSYDLISLRMAVAANSYGWKAIYLGTEIPSDEIANTSKQTNARAVALGIARPSDDPHLPNALRQLHEQLDKGCTLLVCGAAVSGYTEVIEEINAVVVQTMGELRLELDRLKRMSSNFSQPQNS